ncbi:HET-domain-containing protein, partial [Lentithecium fluviatile CBS 122367]
WLRTCTTSHEECRGLANKTPSFAPDRLVEISTNDEGESFMWRLVCPADIGNVQYLTLSHCWGLSPHTSLTRDNYSAFLEPTPDSELPKTFRHALSITFSLGFHFIWIDSLCIVQDDQKDWETQASMMGSVYKHASCNIAATWAADGDDGCLVPRKPWTMTLNHELGQLDEYLVTHSYPYQENIWEAPLNKRGWVAQERFLAKKQLSFAKDQVYWECKELVASEQFPEGPPRELGHTFHVMASRSSDELRKPTLDFTVEAERRKAWSELVNFYSDCKLSKMSDKLIALAGLAEEMRLATGDYYLAGLWKKDLEKQLCWNTTVQPGRRHKVNRSRIPYYLAPSWSWASLDGPV